MASFPRQEVEAAFGRYLETRRRVEAGEPGWEEDLLDMLHVGESIRESGWRPTGSFHLPPRQPRR